MEPITCTSFFHIYSLHFHCCVGYPPSVWGSGARGGEREREREEVKRDREVEKGKEREGKREKEREG
jgi:hypothetical protein